MGSGNGEKTESAASDCSPEDALDRGLWEVQSCLTQVEEWLASAATAQVGCIAEALDEGMSKCAALETGCALEDEEMALGVVAARERLEALSLEFKKWKEHLDVTELEDVECSVPERVAQAETPPANLSSLVTMSKRSVSNAAATVKGKAVASSAATSSAASLKCIVSSGAASLLRLKIGTQRTADADDEECATPRQEHTSEGETWSECERASEGGSACTEQQ